MIDNDTSKCQDFDITEVVTYVISHDILHRLRVESDPRLATTNSGICYAIQFVDPNPPKIYDPNGKEIGPYIFYVPVDVWDSYSEEYHDIFNMKAEMIAAATKTPRKNGRNKRYWLFEDKAHFDAFMANHIIENPVPTPRYAKSAGNAYASNQIENNIPTASQNTVVEVPNTVSEDEQFQRSIEVENEIRKLGGFRDESQNVYVIDHHPYMFVIDVEQFDRYDHISRTNVYGAMNEIENRGLTTDCVPSAYRIGRVDKYLFTLSDLNEIWISILSCDIAARSALMGYSTAKTICNTPVQTTTPERGRQVAGYENDEDGISMNMWDENGVRIIQYATDRYGLYTFRLPIMYWESLSDEARTNIMNCARNIALYGNRYVEWSLNDLIQYIHNPSFIPTQDVTTSNDTFAHSVSGTACYHKNGDPENCIIKPTMEQIDTIKQAVYACQMDYSQYFDECKIDKHRANMDMARAALVGEVLDGFTPMTYLNANNTTVGIRVIDGVPCVYTGTKGDPSNTIMNTTNSVPVSNMQDFANIYGALKDGRNKGIELTLEETATVVTNYIAARDNALVNKLETKGVLGSVIGEEKYQAIQETEMSHETFNLLSPVFGNDAFTHEITLEQEDYGYKGLPYKD